MVPHSFLANKPINQPRHSQSEIDNDGKSGGNGEMEMEIGVLWHGGNGESMK